MKKFLLWFGTLASSLALILQALGISGNLTWASALFLAAVACLAAAVAHDPLERSLRFIVKQACWKIKEHAGETIDIAAGDCSWLPEELPMLKSKLDGGINRIRLLCRPTEDPACRSAIDELASCDKVDVRTYPADFQMYLRCIIIDRNRPQNQAMILLDKKFLSRNVLGIGPRPAPLRRDHKATFVPSDTRLFGLVCAAFERAFDAGSNWTHEDQGHGTGGST